jgi:hypothetical protein
VWSGPRPSNVGSQATSSFDPIVGKTAAGSTTTPNRRCSAPANAARSAGVPEVVG